MKVTKWVSFLFFLALLKSSVHFLLGSPDSDNSHSKCRTVAEEQFSNNVSTDEKEKPQEEGNWWELGWRGILGVAFSLSAKKILVSEGTDTIIWSDKMLMSLSSTSSSIYNLLSNLFDFPSSVSCDQKSLSLKKLDTICSNSWPFVWLAIQSSVPCWLASQLEPDTTYTCPTCQQEIFTASAGQPVPYTTCPSQPEM